MLTRRERLERIATAERDRRAGRVGLAIAAIGEPAEWAARAVLALAHIPAGAAEQARRVLEEGLDRWAADLGLAPLDASDVGSTQADGTQAAAGLGDALEADEFERAFAEAEAEVESMHDVNAVAARVLMDEPLGLCELGGDVLAQDVGFALHDVEPLESSDPTPDVEPLESSDPTPDVEPLESSDPTPDVLALADAGPGSKRATIADHDLFPDVLPMDAAVVEEAAGRRLALEEAPSLRDEGNASRVRVIATLERWLGNLERRRAGRAQ